MGGPSAELAQALIDLAADQDVEVDVHEAPPNQLTVPSLVVRPDSPWMVAAGDDQPFGTIAESYVVVAVVGAGDPISAKDQLRQLVRLAIGAAEGLRTWRWIETSGIAPADNDGIEYLTSSTRVTYSAEDV